MPRTSLWEGVGVGGGSGSEFEGFGFRIFGV